MAEKLNVITNLLVVLVLIICVEMYDKVNHCISPF